MRFLVDESVSPRIAGALNQAGHDAVHVRAIGMGGEPDELIARRADEEQRIIVTEDVGFASMALLGRVPRRSVILFRDRIARASTRSRLLLMHMDSIKEALDSGAVVVVDDTTIRIHRLSQGDVP